MEAEIVEQRDHHLTVLKKKSSIDQADEEEEDDSASMEMRSSVVAMDEIGRSPMGQRPSTTKGLLFFVEFI